MAVVRPSANAASPSEYPAATFGKRGRAGMRGGFDAVELMRITEASEDRARVPAR
jgi:hypothetical protein